MSPQRVDRWIWVLIYAGLLAVGLGLALRRADDALGWGLVGIGSVLALAGAVLVWVRSRMGDQGPP